MNQDVEFVTRHSGQPSRANGDMNWSEPADRLRMGFLSDRGKSQTLSSPSILS